MRRLCLAKGAVRAAALLQELFLTWLHWQDRKCSPAASAAPGQLAYGHYWVPPRTVPRPSTLSRVGSDAEGVWCRQDQRGRAAAAALAPGGKSGQLRAAVQAVLRRGVCGRALHLRARGRCARSDVALQVVRSPAALKFQEVCCIHRLRSCGIKGSSCLTGEMMGRMRFEWCASLALCMAE